MANPRSSPLPPRKVEYSRPEPSGESFVTKASKLGCGYADPGPPPCVGCAALRVGKSVETVSPVTKACPSESTAMSYAFSPAEPPRYVEYTSDPPSGATFATKALPQPSVQSPSGGAGCRH